MRAYFSQFGPISRLRLSRNRTSGASKHYAFLEFVSGEVAQVVAATMDNYLLFGHILKCKLVPKEQVHEKLWVGANKRFKKVPWSKIEGRKLEQPMGREHWEKKVERERSKRGEKAKKLKEVMDYELDAPVKAVADLPVRAVEAITEGAADADEDSTIVTGGGNEGTVLISQKVTTKKVVKGKKAKSTETKLPETTLSGGISDAVNAGLEKADALLETAMDVTSETLVPAARKGKKGKSPGTKSPEATLGSGIADAVSAGIEKADAMLETAMDAANEVLVPTARKGKRKADEALEAVQETVNDAIGAATKKEPKKPKKGKESKEAKTQKVDDPRSSKIPDTKLVEGSAIADEMLKSREGATNDGILPIAKTGKRKAKEALEALAPVEDEPTGQTLDEPKEPTTKKPKRDKKPKESLSEPANKLKEPSKGKSNVNEAPTAKATEPATEKAKRKSKRASEAPAPVDTSAPLNADSAKSAANKPGKKAKQTAPTEETGPKEPTPSIKKPERSAKKVLEEIAPKPSKDDTFTSTVPAPQSHKADPPGPPLKPAQSTPLSAITAPKRSNKGKDTVEETFEHAEEHGVEEAEKELKKGNAAKGKGKGEGKKNDGKAVEREEAASKAGATKYPKDAKEKEMSKAKKDNKKSTKEANAAVGEPAPTISEAAPIDHEAASEPKKSAKKQEKPKPKGITNTTEETDAPANIAAPTSTKAETPSKAIKPKTKKPPLKPTIMEKSDTPKAPESHKADPPGPALNPQQTTPATALTAPIRSHGGTDTVEETFENAEEQGVKAAEREMQQERSTNTKKGSGRKVKANKKDTSKPASTEVDNTNPAPGPLAPPSSPPSDSIVKNSGGNSTTGRKKDDKKKKVAGSAEEDAAKVPLPGTEMPKRSHRGEDTLEETFQHAAEKGERAAASE